MKRLLHILLAFVCVGSSAQEIVAGLTREGAEAKVTAIAEELRQKGAFKDAIESEVITVDGRKMRYLEKTFGDTPEGERSLWISLHGGGGGPAAMNDGQWKNQIRLYAPKEGIVVAPRAPTNTWNLWHEKHIDDLLDALIAAFVAERGVDPNRVYLMGYSAGGDGVYQLAPRMADRFAAASMMAGHPNDASPLGLRNLPFRIFMGGNDAAYKRNEVAAEWGRKLADLREGDAQGYEHEVTIYKGLGHWMNGKDREALPWMSARIRNAWPKKVVWHQSSRLHERFYWLSVAEGEAKKGQTVRAEVQGQMISVTTEGEGLTGLRLLLHDELIDLDQEISVSINGVDAFSGRVMRTEKAIRSSLGDRLDETTTPTAILSLSW